MAIQERITSGCRSLRCNLAEQAMPYTPMVVPTGNPFAKLLVRLFAKLVGVTFVVHGAMLSNAELTGAALLPRPG